MATSLKARRLGVRRARLRARSKRSPVLPRQVLPVGIERDYTRALLRINRETRAALAPVVAALPALLKSANAERERFDVGETRTLERLMVVARRKIERILKPHRLEKLARFMAGRTSDWQAGQFLKQIRATALGKDLVSAVSANPFASTPGLKAITDGFVHSNVGLITEISVGMARDIEGVAMRALTRATTNKDLAKELRKKFGFAKNKAKLVARDQIGKLYGQINEHRQKAIGVKKFTWRSSQDRRVRGTPGGAFPNAKPSHHARNGKVFAYSDPRFKNPFDGVPGVPIQCRCHAEPVFDDLLEGL